MFKPTTEQQAIIDAVKACSAVKVYALAGTGKTTTLRLIAEAYPKARMLYLAFNKAIADEARNKFPDNVDVRTVHSLAFGYVGKHYWGRLSNLDYHAIADVLRLDLFFVFANIKFYERYCHSAVPFTEEDIEAFMEGQGVGVLNDRERVKIVRFIYNLHNALKTNEELSIHHDFYLKEFQLNFDGYSCKNRYDLVLLDEAQDTNAVTLDIFNRFQSKKIMVGDRHQKIYGFRGAINGMEWFKADKTLYLTYTFRFSEPDQVRFANDLLYYCKAEDKSHLIKPIGKKEKKRCRTSCIITRTNARLIEYFSRDRLLKPVRHPNNFFDKIFKIFDRKIKVGSVGRMLSFFGYLDKLEEMAKALDDVELLGAVKLIRKFGDRDFFEELYETALENYKNPSLSRYIGTAHSCKGLEFDRVEIANDFPRISEMAEKLYLQGRCNVGEVKKVKGINVVSIPKEDLKDFFAECPNKIKEEINLLYVAGTRAKVEMKGIEGYCVEDVRFPLEKENAESN